MNVTPQEPPTELQPTVIASAKIPPESDEQVSLVCIVVLQVFVPFACELLFSRYGAHVIAVYAHLGVRDDASYGGVSRTEHGRGVTIHDQVIGSHRDRLNPSPELDTSEGAKCAQATSVPVQLLLPDRGGTKQHDVTPLRTLSCMSTPFH